MDNGRADNIILEIADRVTADFEGYSYLRHGEEKWVLEFAKRLMEMFKNQPVLMGVESIKLLSPEELVNYLMLTPEQVAFLNEKGETK